MTPHLHVRPPCAAEPELFFPVQESVLVCYGPTAGETRALMVCWHCPVLAVCRTHVLAADLPFGVAGGMTAAERRAARAVRRTPVTV